MLIYLVFDGSYIVHKGFIAAQWESWSFVIHDDIQRCSILTIMYAAAYVENEACPDGNDSLQHKRIQ